MLQRKIEVETLPYCMSEQIGLITYGTLAGGLLTGKYRSLPAFSEEDNRSRFYDFYKPEIWPLIQGLLQLLDTISSNHHCTVAQVAIAWAAQQKGITSVLVGAKRKEQALSNAKAAPIELSNTEYEAIDRYLKKHLRAVVF
jgi:aryl-alcohol dehydrogenase-like predicted oxidoreductase